MAQARYRYGKVECALGAIFDLDAKTQAGPLRGRLKLFRRLGLPGNPGTGTRVDYNIEQAAQWFLALLMSDAGVPPSVAVNAIKKYWKPDIASWVEMACEPGSLVYLFVLPRPMSGTWVTWQTGARLDWIGILDPRSGIEIVNSPKHMPLGSAPSDTPVVTAAAESFGSRAPGNHRRRGRGRRCGYCGLHRHCGREPYTAAGQSRGQMAAHPRFLGRYGQAQSGAR